MIYFTLTFMAKLPYLRHTSSHTHTQTQAKTNRRMRVFCTYGEINNYVRVCALK